MEKISRIVRGNSRVAAVDLKNAAPVRPGTPSFGRPVGESSAVNIKSLSTADRALALHKEMQQAKIANSNETVVQNMTDKFFRDRVSRSEPEYEDSVPSLEASAPDLQTPVVGETEEGEAAEQAARTPRKYTPRGSYIDVRA